MNHVKEIELFENRNFKSWAKYNRYLSIKYYDDNIILLKTGIKRQNEVSVFSEANQITISIKYNYTVSNVALLKLYKDFENLVFKIYPETNCVVFEVYNVPKSYFDKIDFELNIEKYNI
jgi:hypothetical protein